MILTKTNTRAKYQNGISYHLLLCFLAENEIVRFISSWGHECCLYDFRWLFYQWNCLKSLFSVSWKNTCKIRLHVYTSLRAGVARSSQPIKTLNDKFSLVRKHRSSNQRPWTMIFHRVKFRRSWCQLTIANLERLLHTSISMNKSLYSYNKDILQIVIIISYHIKYVYKCLWI